MKAKSILTTAALLIAALFILDVPAANAAGITTWNGNDNVNWSDPDNWTSDGGSTPPGNGDTVIIPSGEIARDPTVDSATNTVASVTIQSDRTVTVNAAMNVSGTTTVNSGGTLALGSTGASLPALTVSGTVTTGANTLTISNASGLTINAGGLLNVDGAGTVNLTGGGTHTINATAANYGLRLSVSGSTLQITDSDVTLTGTGYVDGRNNGAQILITDGETLTSYITIEGALTIDEVPNGTPEATFLNYGLVHANRTSADWILTVATATIDDSSGYRWQVSAHATARLRFSTTATGLEGTFDLDNGTLDIDANVTTTGDLDFQGGKIEVYQNTTFQAS